MAEYSPMMQKYLETKEQYRDCILFYRLGDFYEMFFDDAVNVSRELELTLTGKDCGQAERAPMCGVPFHAADTYINRLVEKGYKVAICEQVEDPKQAKGLVKREVIKVVTPGTNFNSGALNEDRNNYLMCIAYMGRSIGLAVTDVTTGEFMVSELSSGRELLDEINKFAPSEIICNESFDISGIDLTEIRNRLSISMSSLDQFDPVSLVEDGLAVGFLPAPALPAGDPFGDAVLEVLAVCVQGDFRAFRCKAQGHDGCQELHAVIRRRRIAVA